MYSEFVGEQPRVNEIRLRLVTDLFPGRKCINNDFFIEEEGKVTISLKLSSSLSYKLVFLLY